MRITLIIGLCFIVGLQFYLDNSDYEETHNTTKYDSLLCKNYQLMKQNDSLKAEIETCKWMGKREYYSINKNIK